MQRPCPASCSAAWTNLHQDWDWACSSLDEPAVAQDDEGEVADLGWDTTGVQSGLMGRSWLR
eukprot:scaffold65190_cov22-Tisochrysis_lutea.AAC.1